MAEEKLKFIGAYVSETMYYKLRVKCAQKGTNVSKALINLISIFTKDVVYEKSEFELENQQRIKQAEVDRIVKEIESKKLGTAPIPATTAAPVNNVTN